jgi:hypothetical protein
MTRPSIALLCLSAALVHLPADAQDCRYVDRAIEPATIIKSVIAVTRASPAEGSEVKKTTVIGVDVEYHIADFEAGNFLLHAVFDTEEQVGMTLGRIEDYPALTSAAGRVHLCVPLNDVYEHPTIRFPLKMSVTLSRREHDVPKGRMAVARPLEFQAVDLPRGASERMAAAAPPEYHAALQRAHVSFSMLGIQYKVCVERHPDMQLAYTQAYRAWESRHRADIDLVTEQYFEMLRKRVGGRADLAARFADESMAGFRKIYEEENPSAFRRSCEKTSREMAEDAGMTPGHLAKELQTVHKYAAKQVQGGGE